MPKRTLASLMERPVEDPTKASSSSGVEITRKMSFSDRQALMHDIEMSERSLKANKDENDPRVLKEIYRKRMLLAQDDEITFSGDQKDLAYKELKEIEDRIKPHMPTKNEMWPKNDITAKSQAVRHNLTFQEKYDKDVLRWQELKRRLEPENPHAQNLDLIRPD